MAPFVGFIEAIGFIGKGNIPPVPLLDRVLGFGDSTMYGIDGNTGTQTAAANRPLNILATNRGKTAYNAAISGTVLQNGADTANSGGNPRPNNGYNRYVADTLGANASAVVVCNYGLNDLRYTAVPANLNITNFLAQYRVIVDAWKAAGIEVILASPVWIPDAGYSTGSSGFTGSTRTLHEQYVAGIWQIAKDKGVKYANSYERMKAIGATTIGTDNIHPTAAVGYATMGQSYIEAYVPFESVWPGAPVDSTAPTANSAAVANATPTNLAITMSEAMDTGNVPAASAFTVSGHTVSAVGITGSTINLTVSAFVNGEAARTVEYTQPGTANARDLAGNLLANFTGLSVTNNVLPSDVTAPTATTAAVANSTPSVVNLTLSEAMNTGVTPAASAFTVSGHTVSSVVYGSSTVLNITVTPAFANGDAASTLAYTQPGTNNAQDAAGNLLANFSGLSITNNVADIGSDADVTDYLARIATASGTLSGPEETAIRAFVNSAKTSTNAYWSQLAIFQPMAGNAAASLVKLKGATADTNVGTTYAAATGRITNGTSQYLNTNYQPTGLTGGVSVYLRTNVTASTTIRIPIGVRNTANTHAYRITANSGSNGSASSGGVASIWGGTAPGPFPSTTGGMTAGFWHNSRTDSTTHKLYKNGTLLSTNATAVVPVDPAFPLYVFANNGAGTVGSYLEANASIGAYGVDIGMTEAQAADYGTHVQTLMTALGRNV